MSSKGFDYVTEDVREFAEEELDEAFGEGQWQLEAGEYTHLGTPKDFPAQMIIVVVGKFDKAGQEIGILTIENNFFVDGNGESGDRWIEVEPRSVESIKVMSKLLPKQADVPSSLKVYVIVFHTDDCGVDIEKVFFERKDAEDYLKFQNENEERQCDESELRIEEKEVSHSPRIGGWACVDYEAIEKALRNAIGAEVVELASVGKIPKEKDDKDYTVSRLVRNILHNIAEGQDF